MRELRIRLLAGVFAVAGVLSWAGARLWNSVGTLPSVPLAAPIVLALIAVVLVATALSIRARLKVGAGGWRVFDIIATLITSRGKEPEEIIATLREVAT